MIGLGSAFGKTLTQVFGLFTGAACINPGGGRMVEGGCGAGLIGLIGGGGGVVTGGGGG